MSEYITLTAGRSTLPDLVTLIATLRSTLADPTAVLLHMPDGSWLAKKAAKWSAVDATAAQATLDSTPALTAQLSAQRIIDTLPIETKAVVLALIDQLNVIRAALPSPLGAVTPTQALAAVRTKAGTL